MSKCRSCQRLQQDVDRLKNLLKLEPEGFGSERRPIAVVGGYPVYEGSRVVVVSGRLDGHSGVLRYVHGLAHLDIGGSVEAVSVDDIRLDVPDELRRLYKEARCSARLREENARLREVIERTRKE